MNGLTSDSLGATSPVHLGCVDAGKPEIDPGPQCLNTPRLGILSSIHVPCPISEAPSSIFYSSGRCTVTTIGSLETALARERTCTTFWPARTSGGMTADICPGDV